MFTNLKLKNFKSFKDVTIDLQQKKNDPKPLAVIYGANGSGKSTITQAFVVFKKMMITLQIRDIFNHVLNEYMSSDDMPNNSDKVLEMIKSNMTNSTVESIIQECKMVNTTEKMSLEYEFIINGATGSYLMEFDDTNIIKERLEYKLVKNRGCYFNIENGKAEINDKIFKTSEYLQEITKQVEKYWGKHSLLSILMFEMTDKNKSYIDSNLSINIKKVLKDFRNISFKLKETNINENISLMTSNTILRNLKGGEIDKADESKLYEVEKIINDCFSKLFDNVNRTFYKTIEEDEKIKYELFLNKQIENHKFDINFKYESSGTQEILDLLPYLMLAISGKCVIIDEFGNGIHDLLASELLRVVSKDIKGQLILTTHNTLIMDNSDLKPESLYFIMNNNNFNKSVKCVTEIEDRLHKNYNYRNRYFNNSLYADSLPKLDNNIDFSELAGLYK